MPEPLVRSEWQDDIAILTLNRAARHNALVPGLLADLLGAIDACTAGDAAAMVLTAEGPSFSTGGDLLGFYRHRESIGQYADRLVGLLNDVILAMWRLPLVTACSVEGQVCGGSLGLLLASDRVVMSRRASVAPWYGAIGFNPDGGWQAMLPGVIGDRQTERWLAEDSRYDANRCLELGLAHQLVDADAVDAAVTWARAVSMMDSASTEALRMRRNYGHTGLASRLAAEKTAFVQKVQSAEALLGIERYLARKASLKTAKTMMDAELPGQKRPGSRPGAR